MNKSLQAFGELDSNDVISEEEADRRGFNFSFNMPINNKYFKGHEDFFASIGYIALQVAVIEDELRQSMIAMTNDYEAVHDQTQNKNLGSLLSLYEIVFLARFGDSEFLKKSFYALKFVLRKANRIRNEAVHSQWLYINGKPNKPCFNQVRKKQSAYVIITPTLMRKRAIFVYRVFGWLDDLRCITEGPDGWDGSIQAKKNLTWLIKKVALNSSNE
jgi:hypothetical protein